jgi:threonine dehydrogenase-like Zn-dependent dehydrogenase
VVALDPAAVGVSEAIRELTGGRDAHKSIECGSNAAARTQSVDCLRKWGAACMVGVNGEITVPISTLIHKQVRVLGSWTFSKTAQAECAQFILERGIDIDKLFNHEFSLDEAVSAYQLFDDHEDGKGRVLAVTAVDINPRSLAVNPLQPNNQSSGQPTPFSSMKSAVRGCS